MGAARRISSMTFLFSTGLLGQASYFLLDPNPFGFGLYRNGLGSTEGCVVFIFALFFCLYRNGKGSQPISSLYRNPASFATPFCCAPSKKYYLADHIIDHNKAMVPGMGADSPATGPGTHEARSTLPCTVSWAGLAYLR